MFCPNKQDLEQIPLPIRPKRLEIMPGNNFRAIVQQFRSSRATARAAGATSRVFFGLCLGTVRWGPGETCKIERLQVLTATNAPQRIIDVGVTASALAPCQASVFMFDNFPNPGNVRDRFSRTGPICADFGQTLADIAPNFGLVGRNCVKLVENGQTLVELGHTSVRLGQPLPISGKCRPKLGQTRRPNSRRLSQDIAAKR